MKTKMPPAPAPEFPEAAAGQADQPRREDAELSLLEAGTWLLRRWRYLAAPMIVLGSLFILHGVLTPRTYDATASLMPASELSQSEAALGLAGRLTGLFNQSSPAALYADLLRSRSVLAAAATSVYPVPELYSRENAALSAGAAATLIQIWRLDDESDEIAVKKATLRLDERTQVNAEATGIIRLTVTDRSPALAEQIAARLLEQLDEVNRERRRYQAEVEREFMASVLGEAQEALLTAERELEGFLERNRRFRASPELTFEHERFQRRVQLRESMYHALAQGYEAARMEAIRNVPATTVLDPPESSVAPNSRRLPLRAATGLMMGALLGVVLAAASDRIPALGRRTRRLRV